VSNASGLISHFFTLSLHSATPVNQKNIATKKYQRNNQNQKETKKIIITPLVVDYEESC